MSSEGYQLETFGRRVGRTPLLRAKKLESEFGMKEIHLKLEGTNPTGHKSDRIAHQIIRDAMNSIKNTVTLGTTGYLATSLGHLANYANLKCVFFVPRLTKKITKQLKDVPNLQVIETGGSYERAITESKKQARENDWYDANPGLKNSILGMAAYSPIARELVDSLGGPPDSISMALGEGTLLSGIHLGFRQLWSTEEIDSIPPLYAGSLSGKNAIVSTFLEGHRILHPIEGNPKKASHRFTSLQNIKGLNGQYALDSLFDSKGRGFNLSEAEMLGYTSKFQKLEKVRIEPECAGSLGAFMKAQEESLLEIGKRHVIILGTGKTDITVRTLTKELFSDNYSLLISLLDKWLTKFSDPYDEIEEALDNAFEKGFVIGAFQGAQLIGICVLSKMELDTFFPSYHLSYIAADEKLTGRGIATYLIDKAIELSKGNLSLHVEPENKRAIRLYKKMGLDIQYYRMKFRKEM